MIKDQAAGPRRYLTLSTANNMDHDRCRCDQPSRDGADGAVDGYDVQTSSRIIQRSCGLSWSAGPANGLGRIQLEL